MDVLRKKQFKQYTKLSKYQLLPIYYHTLDEKYIQGTPANLFNNTAYIWHTVQHNDTYDNISLYYYGNPTYYWIICDFNRIQNPFDNPVPGTQLMIPTFSDIEFDII